MRRLILWDIDGTLITSRGVGRRVMEEAAAAVAGLAEVPQIVMSGKTDPQILREIFTTAELAADHIESLLPDAMVAAERALASKHCSSASTRRPASARPCSRAT